MRWLTWRTVPALTVASLVLLLFAFPLFTGALDMRLEYGYDGTQYVKLVTALRTSADARPEAPFAYRFLPSAVVALSGLDPWTGFLALDTAALVGTALLLLALVRPYVSPAAALALAVSWGLLPLGLRFAVHYPILTDPLAAFFFTALLLAAQRGAVRTFALLLVAAVLTRENLIILAPLLFLRTIGRDRRTWIGALAAAVPASLALVAVRIFPPVAAGASGPATLQLVAYYAWGFVTDHDGRTWRVLAAPLFAFGAAVGPLATRRSLEVLVAEPGWSYTVVATVVTAALGGGDPDRYLFVLAPLVIVVAARATPALARTRMAITLAAAQLVAGRLAMPLGSDHDTHMAFAVGVTSLDVVALWSAAVVVCAAIVWLVARAPLPLRHASASLPS